MICIHSRASFYYIGREKPYTVLLVFPVELKLCIRVMYVGRSNPFLALLKQPKIAFTEISVCSKIEEINHLISELKEKEVPPADGKLT